MLTPFPRELCWCSQTTLLPLRRIPNSAVSSGHKSRNLCPVSELLRMENEGFTMRIEGEGEKWKNSISDDFFCQITFFFFFIILLVIVAASICNFRLSKSARTRECANIWTNFWKVRCEVTFGNVDSENPSKFHLFFT